MGFLGLDFFLLVAVNLANLGLGVGVLLRNPRLVVSRAFAFLAFAIVFWATMNFVSDYTSASFATLFARLTLVGGVLIVSAGIYLGCVFPDNHSIGRRFYNRIQIWLAIIVATISLTPLVIASAQPGYSGAVLDLGVAYYVYVVYLTQAIAIIAANFTTQARHAKLQYQKDQLFLVMVGFVTYALFALICNIIIPTITNDWTSSRYGPLFSFILVGMAAYAIVKHRLFDIRRTIVRSLLYMGISLLFTFLYGGLVIGIIDLIFGLNLSFLPQVMIAAATGIAAVSFQLFQRTFNRMTDKFFYRDNYDTQDFFRQFNHSEVASTDLDAVLRIASDTIVSFLKAQYCLIYIPSRSRRIYTGQSAHKKTAINNSKQLHFMKETDAFMVVADDLPTEKEMLRRHLYDHDMSIIVRLRMGDNATETAGYIVLGPRLDGGSYSRKDVSVIGSAANELSLAMQNALRFEEISNFNKTLQSKVDEATTQLRATNTELQRLDEAKDEFISMASHQLRTPLTSVKGYISMVLEGDAGKISANQQELLSEAFASSERMVRLINDFLNVSRLQTGKFMLEQRSIDLAKVVEQEVDSLQVTVQMHSLKLRYRKPAHFPMLNIDDGKIRQVIMNFIDNAIYYSHEGTTIDVRLAVEEGYAVLRVHDTGIGVPKPEQRYLFSKFFRATNARKQRPDGTGVGLFLAKKIIMAHGGTMLFESTEGKGSTFGFRLPVKKLAAEEPAGAK